MSKLYQEKEKIKKWIHDKNIETFSEFGLQILNLDKGISYATIVEAWKEFEKEKENKFN